MLILLSNFMDEETGAERRFGQGTSDVLELSFNSKYACYNISDLFYQD